jgi:two-component system LytT family response regulator
MLRSIIIDDEPLGVSTLEVLIERLGMDISVDATATDPEKAIALIEAIRPDVIFLDVNMPKLNGFQLLEKLNYKDMKIVFTTAHKEHAIKAIKNHAQDYLLKPIDTNELKACVERLLEELKPDTTAQRSRSYLELPVSDGIVMIKQSNIVRVEASGSYATLYLKDGTKYTASKNLKHFEAVLDPLNFCRCHQSHIVNLHEVIKLVSSEGYVALLSDQSKAEVGKTYKEVFMAKLKVI